MLTKEQLALAERWPGATNVRPCTVKIGRTSYEGFAYNVPEGFGTTDGTPQPSWGDQRFYLLGDLPPSAGRAVYRIDGDDGDWYMGGYVTRETATSERYGKHHPLGAHFLLMRWPHEQFGDRVDQYEIGSHGRIHPRPRMNIEVTYA